MENNNNNQDYINTINVTSIECARNLRNELLNKSDKYLLSDYPISESNLNLIKQYRQDLRNFMDLDAVKNYSFPSTFPDIPTFPTFQ